MCQASPSNFGTKPKIKKKKLFNYSIILLLAWYLVSSFKIFPNYLSYFNELTGGPQSGYRYLVDTNLDWGQDLIGLRKFLEKENNPEVIFSYFGSAPPYSYGIEYQDLYSFNVKSSGHINSLNPAKEFLVISASSFQCLYLPDKKAFDWLKEMNPVKTIGHSIFIYDITDDELSHIKIGMLYIRGNFLNEGEREFKRVLRINPGNQQAKIYLDYVIEKSNNK